MGGNSIAGTPAREVPDEQYAPVSEDHRYEAAARARSPWRCGIAAVDAGLSRRGCRRGAAAWPARAAAPGVRQPVRRCLGRCRIARPSRSATRPDPARALVLPSCSAVSAARRRLMASPLAGLDHPHSPGRLGGQARGIQPPGTRTRRGVPAATAAAGAGGAVPVAEGHLPAAGVPGEAGLRVPVGSGTGGGEGALEARRAFGALLRDDLAGKVRPEIRRMRDPLAGPEYRLWAFRAVLRYDAGCNRGARHAGSASVRSWAHRRESNRIMGRAATSYSPAAHQAAERLGVAVRL